MNNKDLSAETKADSTSEADVTTSRQTNANAPVVGSVLSRKLGRINISKSFLMDEPNEKYLKEFFSNFFPMAIENNHTYGLYNALTYIGFSPHFRNIEEAEIIPEYKAVLDIDKDGNVSFDKFEEWK